MSEFILSKLWSQIKGTYVPCNNGEGNGNGRNECLDINDMFLKKYFKTYYKNM